MNVQHASLLCDRCGRASTDRPDGGFRFCRSCALYVCPRCWSLVSHQCQVCARPDVADVDRPTSRSIRDTIAPPPLGNPRVTEPRLLQSALGAGARRAPLPGSPPRRRASDQLARAATAALRVGSRLLVAASLAIAAMAVFWAVDLSMDSATEQRAGQTNEGTLSGTPPPITAAPSAAVRSSAATARSHTVLSGETLIELAARYYGDETRWREIYRANADRIADPDNLRVGTVLVIPPR
jgi:hypothetical protein